MPSADGLEMSDESEAGEESNEEEDSEAENGFPELDSGSDEGGDETDSPEEDLSDEEDGSQSGYNSSDLDDISSSTSVSSRSESGRAKTTDEKLSEMMRKGTTKPDEGIGAEGKLSRAKDGNGRLIRSKLVEGGYKREYEDVEAGYGSESSTEDVSAFAGPNVRYTAENMSSYGAEPQYGGQRAYGVVR